MVEQEQEQMAIPGVEISGRRKYPKLQSLEDIPVSRSQLSFEWIVEYAAANGTPEQTAELLDFIKRNQVKRESNLKTCKGAEFTVTDIKPLRNLFCGMFFPELRETKSPAKKESQADMAERLLGPKAALVAKTVPAPAKKTATRARKPAKGSEKA